MRRTGWGSAWSRAAARGASMAATGGVLSPLRAAQGYFKEWIDPTISATITGSPVSMISYPVPDGYTQRKNFQRSTSAGTTDRPAITANRLVFDGVNDCLDGSAGYTYIGAVTPADPFYCQAGKGPTTCGLARVADGTWWLGHYGKKHQSTAAGETFDGSIIHYSANFLTILQEIRFQSLSLADVGIQGVTLDYTAGVPTGYVWCADPANGKLYKINPAGPTVLTTLTFAAVNGCAYDTINDQIWVCVANSKTLTRINKATGATVTSFVHRDLTDNALDMLFFDGSYGASGALYTTGRDNGNNGRIVKYDIASGTPVKAWSISEIQSMEGGLHVTGSTFDTCDDEYYHAQVANVNRIVATTADTSSPDYGTRIILAGVCKIAATPAATVSLAHGGDSISFKGVGLFFTTTPNQFRMIFRGSGVQATVDWLITSTTTEFLYYLDINSATGDSSLYINGVLISTQNNAAVAGSLPSLVWTIAASYENATAIATRFSNTTIGGFIVSTDATHQAEIEGYLSWQTQGSGALLQVGHTYKNAAPT